VLRICTLETLFNPDNYLALGCWQAYPAGA
jgi:hypothetical protein